MAFVLELPNPCSWLRRLPLAFLAVAWASTPQVVGLANVHVVPRRVSADDSSPWASKAMEVLWEDGAVIVTGLAPAAITDFQGLASELPRRLFREISGSGVAEPDPRPELLSPEAPVSAVHEELHEAKRRGKYLPGSGLLPHTDGYVYGDYMPDFVTLLCEQPSPQGGANSLLDGSALLRELATDSKPLAEWLATVSVDLSESSSAGLADGRPAEGPIVQTHTGPSGRVRLKWRRQINNEEVQRLEVWHPLHSNGSSTGSATSGGSDRYLSLWRPLPGASPATAAEIEAQLRAFDVRLQEATEAAVRRGSFFLDRGEALVIDNWRLLHARAPYVPDQPGEGSQLVPERKIWRVWSWTSEGSGLPPDGAKTSQPLDDDVFSGKAEL